ncbi:MAG: c-type cytochrome [Gemmataceae bacterium]
MRHATAVAALLFVSPLVGAGSSNSLLDVSPDGKRLLVANTDSGTVTVVDLATRQKVCELPAGDHPEGVAWVAGGPLAVATVYGDDKLVFLDTAKKAVVGTLAVADEPYGVVTTKDGKFAYVSHDYPGTVSEIDLTARTVARTFKVGAGCRGIALSNDEKTLYVAEFFTANLLAVDRSSGKVVDRWDGFSSDNLCRHVTLHPTRPKAYLSHTRSRVTAFDARGSVFPQLSFCDLWTRTDGEKRRRSVALDTYNNVSVVTNPWEAALSPDGRRLYSVYAGTDDMNVSRVFDDDYREVAAVGRLVSTGKHPRAVRVSPDGKEVYVYATLDYAVQVFDADLKRQATIPVCTPPHSAAWRRGKELFQTAKQPMGSARWIACSSCHPDGLTDGRTWHNPEGLRKTPNLFGLAHTHPLHWSADRDESQDFEYTIRGKLMQGRGLSDQRLRPAAGPTDFAALEAATAGQSADLDALAVYCNSFPVRLSPHVPAPGKLSAEAQRGKALFFDAKTQCATCHSGPYYTDGTLAKPFKLHDVGTGGGADEKIGPMYDTPTLLGAYRVHAYLHDGRAKTLAEVLTVHNKGDKHGTTSHLSAAQVDDLVSYLKSLPYEAPPDDTPNAVKHREKLNPVTLGK